ncbi:hypothetical protein FB451DRAFT_1252002 [Mycena latifolia]|nr:hypothetical protein FB451DRAFT_1252002 [Mycena latifolia]
MPSLSLDGLPQEIILEILNLLDGKTLIQSCSLVCHRWKYAIDNSAELQYTLELWGDGMVVGDPSNSPFVEKLGALHERRRAWFGLNWTSKTVVPIDSSSGAYELVNGVFAQQNSPLESFTTISLPSARDPVPKMASTSDIGVPFRDFVIDPTQDLVAFVYERPNDSANVDCRTLSSLKPHPLAAAPVLSFPVEDFSLGYLLVELAGDVIGLFFGRSGRVVLLNWQRGIIIADSARTHDPCGFSLLSPQAFILGHAIGSGVLDIWAFEGRDSNIPRHAVGLQLPKVVDDGRLEYMITHSGAFRAKPAAGKPFSKSNESRICVVSLEYYQDSYSLFIPHHYLQGHLSMDNNARGRTVPWDDWGPQHSRMLPGMDHRWLRYVHGECVVLSGDTEHPKAIQILDFGMSASRPGVDVEMAQSPHSTCELHTEPSTISDDSVFEEPVTTSLPYRRIARPVGEDYTVFMIDEDQIIGVDEENRMTVYTF